MRDKSCRIIISIVIGIVIAFYCVYYMLCPRSGFLEEFYKQSENTVDVLFLGSSNAYSNINPAILWEEHGISSFMLCGNGQPIWNSYYYLEEAYKTQTPKLVVLEMFTVAAYPGGYDELGNVPCNTLSLKMSKTKINAMKNSVTKADYLSLCLGLPIFHNRWTEIFKSELKPWEYDRKNEAITKGFFPVHFFESHEMIEYDYANRTALNEKHIEYLDKIVELTREHNSELLLIKTPYALDASYDAVYNSVSDYALNNGINFINMNTCIEEIGFSFKSDFADTVHLNNIGVEKVSLYLGNIISDDYNIEDHRGQSTYSSWDDFSKLYDKTRFMSPDYSDENVLLQLSDSVKWDVISDTLSIISIPVELQSGKYYKISIKSDESYRQEMVIDIYGEGYDLPQYKRRIWADNDEFVVIQAPDVIDEQIYIRIYAEDASYDISEIIISEVQMP